MIVGFICDWNRDYRNYYRLNLHHCLPRWVNRWLRHRKVNWEYPRVWGFHWETARKIYSTLRPQHASCYPQCVSHWHTRSSVGKKIVCEQESDRDCKKFKYLGITLQTALKFSEHVEKLRSKTATAIVCIENLPKLPIELAMKIFDLKIMSMIKYGMKIVSPNVARSSMENLDRCKSAYIKAMLGLSRHTSNTFVLALTNQKTLCETLRKENYVVEAWNEYAQNLEGKRVKKNIAKRITTRLETLEPIRQR